jgi:putative ABC transport system ATP-binding protein
MILEVEQLSKSFSQGRRQVEALKDVSFSIDQQQSLAIVGPSGSGKSTLLSLLAGLDKVEKGRITLSGKALHEMNEQELTQFRAHHIGIVFQQFHLMPHLTALENVSLPLEILGEDHVQERAREILEQVGLKDRIHHKPSELSGGECQRVAIARASVARPKILLADEPSGNLDTETGEKVMNLLFQLVKDNGMTLILITHDLRLAERCESQLHLVGGKVQ